MFPRHGCFSAGSLAMPIEERDINPAGFIVIFKFAGIRFMEQIGIENDGPVLPVRNR